MLRHSAVVAVAALSLTALASPVRAQNFLNGSLVPIAPGNLRLEASPVHMFGPDEKPDRTGVAFRLGYGLVDSLELDGNAAFFDGFSLVGGAGHFRLLDGETGLSMALGAHQALVTGAPDSTALDLAAQVDTHLSRDIALYGAASYSREFVNGVDNSGFDRLYLVPGLQAAISDRFDVVVEAGLGLNDDSPSYVAAGVSMRVPVTDAARRH